MKIEDLCHLRGNIAPGAFKPGFSVLGFSVACTAVLLCVFVMFSWGGSSIFCYQTQILESMGATVERVRPVSITHKDHFVNVARRRALEAQAALKSCPAPHPTTLEMDGQSDPGSSRLNSTHRFKRTYDQNHSLHSFHSVDVPCVTINAWMFQYGTLNFWMIGSRSNISISQQLLSLLLSSWNWLSPPEVWSFNFHE